MFYYLDGTVAEILPGLAVIDCGGVGYACMTTNNTLSQLKKGEKKKLYTYLNVGESIFDLYGFATQNELNSFKLLLGVSGVGPKAALAILSANTPEGLAMAIVTEDAKSLTAAQGIGKKIAQRIILELKDKMAKETASGLDFSGGKGAAAPAVFTSKATEAAAALAILSANTPEGLAMAIVTEDAKSLTAAQGIGKKIAQRIILELKDKIGGSNMELDFSGGPAAAPVQKSSSVGLATAALQELGYSPAEISLALKGADPNMTTEDLIRHALLAMVMKG